MRAEPTNPITACRNHHNLDLLDFPGKYRSGRKRDNWWLEGTKEYWTHITNKKYIYYQYETLDRNSTVHRAIMETAAECRIGLKKDIHNTLTNKTKITLGFFVIKNRKKRQKKLTKGKTETPTKEHALHKIFQFKPHIKGDKSHRSRFKFHTTELEKEINNEIQKRKRLAIQISEDKWNEAKSATEETKENTRQQAIEAHQHAQEATKDAAEYSPKIRTWDELQEMQVNKNAD